MEKKRLFNRVLQVGLVVRDLDASIKNYESFGIGPWQVLTLDGSNVRDLTVRNKRRDYAIRVAFTQMGEVEWELIQPLDDQSIYSEFLAEHGEGLHHVAVDAENFEETISFCQGKGVGVLQKGVAARDFGFAYLDTMKELACITEIYSRPRRKKAKKE